LLVYYGAADAVTAVVEFAEKDLIDALAPRQSAVGGPY
jgi:hypothetical protein